MIGAGIGRPASRALGSMRALPQRRFIVVEPDGAGDSTATHLRSAADEEPILIPDGERYKTTRDRRRASTMR